MGFDAYPKGQSAEAEREEKLPYGGNTLLFGKLSAQETGFERNRTFVKLESFSTGGFGNMVAHGMQYVKKVILGLEKPTKENDFNEKITSIANMVSSLVKNSQNIMPKGFQSSLQLAFKARVDYAS
ncbi:MAG: hypothetical protein LBR92_04275 [Puniceicoccales bacterium]|jgi:hypothetical protein|nr:hypothetical protein [Puniceicoccales bacterium]